MIRNFVKLFSANVVAQVIGLLVYPILTRIYAPEDFGLLNLFLSIGGIFTLLSVAEYQYAIVLPKQDREAASVFHIGFLLLLLSTIIVAISALFSSQISTLFDSPQLSSFYWLMPVYVFCMGLWNLLNYWYIRQKKFSDVSTYQISQSVLSAGGKIGLGYAGVLQGGMILSTVIAPMVALVCTVVANIKKGIQPLFRFSWQDIRTQTVSYRNFPLFVMPRSLMNVVGGNLPILLLTPYFGLAEIGFFSMAITLTFRPINIVCSSIYQVLYQHISERVNDGGSIFRLLFNYLWKMGVLVLLGFVGLYFMLPKLVVWFLGTDWVMVSDYVRIMLPWLFMVMLNTSVSFLPDVFKRQHIYLVFEIVYVVLRLAALCVGVWMQSIYYAILWFSVVGAIVLLIELVWFMLMVNRYEVERQ